MNVDGRRFGKRFEDKLLARRWAEDLEYGLFRTSKQKVQPYSTLSLEQGHLLTENEFGAVCEDFINKRVFKVVSRKRL